MRTNFQCPDCGARLYIDEGAETDVIIAPKFHARGEPLPTRRVTLPVAFCSGCEFSLPIDLSTKD
jgi:hypothetical protein